MFTFTRNLLHPTLVASSLLFATAAMAGEIFTPDGVAIHGYDPVSYFTDGKPVRGSAAFTSIYKGATFRFVSQAHRDIFATDPEHYSPQYGGFCAYGTARGYKATTEPQAFSIVDGKLYLNYDDEVAKNWSSDRQAFIERADENWDKVKTQASP